MALLVDDAYQDLGLGSVLIENLGEAAAEAGISTFEAEVLASNADMLEVLHNLDFPIETSLSAGAVHDEFPTAPTPEAVESFEQRESIPASAGVARLLRPRSVVVIGSSRRRGTISGEVFHSLLECRRASSIDRLPPAVLSNTHGKDEKTYQTISVVTTLSRHP